MPCALVFGWFGECSPALEHLLSRAAEFGSQRLWQPMMAASGGKARGILMWKQRNVGAAIVRANAMPLMDRVAHTGGDVAAAHSRQSRAESRFFRGGGTSRGFPCSQAAAECGPSMGGAVIGGWVS